MFIYHSGGEEGRPTTFLSLEDENGTRILLLPGEDGQFYPSVIVQRYSSTYIHLSGNLRTRKAASDAPVL